jgi:hypothetical protein
LILPNNRQQPPRLAPSRLEAGRHGGSADLAFIAELAQALQVTLTQLPLELPVPDRLAHNLAGGGEFAGCATALKTPICSPVRAILTF